MKRARGLGRLYARGETWWIQYSFRGERHRESSGSSNRKDAVKLLRRRLGEMGHGHLVGPDVERTTFEDLARFLLDDYRINGRKSQRRAEGALAVLRTHFGTSRAPEITLDRLSAYVRARLEAGRKPATVRNELASLKRAFRLAQKAGKAMCPPFPTLTIRNVRTGFFEQAQFAAVLAHLPDDLQPVAEFLYLTGWRVGETLPLQWWQVDFEVKTVRLEPGSTKNDDGRIFPFATYPALEALLVRQRERTLALEKATARIIPCVFHRDGEPIRDFRGAWQKACEAAGLPGRLVHDFRRTAVRNLERAAVPRSVAMKLTGHKTESVYRRYAIVSEADLAEGVKKLAALTPQESPTHGRVMPLPERKGTQGAQFGTMGG